MKKEIVINASKDRSRIAIVEDGQLVELYVENPDNVRSIGNVYLGRIQKVMPAIRAAFVDVGQKQDCFLHFSDLTDNLPQLQALAGEEVPGLDEPVLSLAPAKRVADDDTEPDVEDALEVASGDDADDGAEDKKKSSRSRGRRRSRGRGRGRGRGRRSEEEEQEEDRLDVREEEEEQEEGRRRLPAVLDLTSAPKRRPARKAEPTPDAPEAEAADAPKAEKADGKKAGAKKAKKADAKQADTPESETPKARKAPADDEAEAPKKPRRSRAKKKAEAPADDAPEAADEPAADDAQDAPEEAAPRSRRRSKKKEEAPADDEANAEAQASDDDGDDEAPAGGRKRSRRRRRGRGSRGRNRGSDDAAGSDDRADADADAGADAGRSRKGDVSPTGRSRRPAISDIEEAAEARAEETADEPDAPKAKTPSRSRRRSKADGAPAEETPADEGADAPTGGRKRLPRTLDLTGVKAKPAAKTAPEPADDDDEPTEGRSRRRSRGRSKADTPAETTDTADAKGDDADDASRSRRRGRRKADDARGADDKADDRQAKTDDKGDGRSRGRGRASSDAKKSDDKKGDRGRSKSSKGGDRGRSGSSGKLPSNEELLAKGNRIIVKITKEAISNKGPRVSTDLSLAGRFLVLVPAADYVAVSKKIESAKERRRLRTLASSLKPDRFGVIVRTVAEGRDAKSLDQDLRLLVDKWRKIEKKLNENPKPPVLLYQDVNMVSSIIRDLFSEDYDRILVDDPKVFKNVQAYVKAVAPSMADKVELHKGRTPVYRSMGIEKQVEEAFSKRVNMRGGGYLFIETTEAMHVVDVNSGRAGRGKSQKQNLIDVNVEAAKEVAKQLRLRDLGGIIVVDFIDLKYDRDRKKVTDALKEAFKKDRAVTKLLPMSDFGLVQITRQRLRPSITANATDEDGQPLDAAEAAAAAGAGEIRRKDQPTYDPADDASDSRAERDDRAPARDDRDDRVTLSPEEATPRALAGRLRGWLDHYRATVDERYRGRPIVVKVHPLFGSYLRRGFPSPLTRWRLALRGITFVMEEDASVDPLAFEVRDQKSGRSLLKKYAE